MASYAVFYPEHDLLNTIYGGVYRSNSLVGSLAALTENAETFLYTGSDATALQAGDNLCHFRKDGTDYIPIAEPIEYRPEVTEVDSNSRIQTVGYLGDYWRSDTVYFIFGSDSLISGASGAIYKDGTATAISPSGITITPNFAVDPTLNLYKINLGASADYEAGADYSIWITCTIGGETITSVLGHFSIENRHEYKGYRYQ